MDIKQLKFLCALDETRHFGQAAARCHVTQPTLSMRLRSLEEELGLELVRRSQRFEGFTEAGERVLAWARSLLAAQEGLYAEAAPAAGNWSGPCAWAWCRWPASTRCAWSSTWPGATRSCVSSSIP